MARPLPNEIEREVTRLFEEGEAFVDEEDDASALACFEAAWKLIPEPKEAWQHALQVLGAVADSHFHLGDYEVCSREMQLVLLSGGEPGHPFITLRLGQCYLELGLEQQASNWLVTAMMSGGVEVFEGEDPKYWAFLRKRLEPPPGGWPKGW